MASHRAAALLVIALGCGSSKQAAPSAVVSATASAAKSVRPADPTAKAICDMPSADPRVCFEIDDDELAAEREALCTGRFAKAASCPRADVVGVCKLPDGSLRFGYSPRSASAHETTCKELQGKFAAGVTPPAAEPTLMVACEGKYPDACEEELTHVSTRLQHAEDECRDYGGTFNKGAGCSRLDARFSCDMVGKKTIVSRAKTNPELSRKFCTDKTARYVEVPGAMPSASAAPSASVDPDAEPPKADVVIRQQ